MERRVARAADDAEAHDLRVGEQSVEIGGVAGVVRQGSGVPSNGAAAVLNSVSSLPGARSEKSTSRSARSADARTRPSDGTGAGLRSRPWSVPIWVMRPSSGSPSRSSTSR